MISKNMNDVVANSSAIRAMFEEGKRLARIHGAENVYDFSLGNPSVYPPAEVKKAIYEILENEDANFVHGYMNNAGYEDVRAAVADSVNREFDAGLSQENVIMTVGAAGAMNIAFKTLLDPGDEVIVFAPFFGEYKRYIENYSGKMVVIPASPDFQPDLDALDKHITDRTKAVIVNSPNNPSGVIYTAETLTEMGRILRGKEELYGKPIYIISDEPYRKIIYDGAEVPFVAKFHKNTLIAYSFSKSLSLPGERIGYLLIPPVVDYYEEILPALSAANRILGFVNAPSLFQRVAARCMDIKVDVSQYQENRDMLYNCLTEAGYRCIKPEGAFYLFPEAPGGDDLEFCNLAKKHNILVVPGRSFGCPGYFRIAYCVDRQGVAGALAGFRTLITEV